MITWVLVDERVGNSNQARALARLLGIEYIEKNLIYNKFAAIPYLIGDGMKILKKESLTGLLTGKPDLIISSGRRASRIAISLKKMYSEAKVIQILNPELGYKHFDLVILPEHDRRMRKQYPNNVLFSFGAISYFNPEELKEVSAMWHELFNKYPQPFISILLGGNSKKCKFKGTHIAEFTELISSIPIWFKGSLLITSSRRTPEALVKEVREKLDLIGTKYYFYEPSSMSENPYTALLNEAKYIIVTGDSISMCSEACLFGKPVFIYAKEDMVSNKHMRFIINLYKSELAKPLTEISTKWEPGKIEPNSSLITKIKTIIKI